MRYFFLTITAMLFLLLSATPATHAAYRVSDTVAALSVNGPCSDVPVIKNSAQHSVLYKWFHSSHDAPVRHKKKWLAILLASVSILTGISGLHRIYLGYVGIGFAQLLLYYLGFGLAFAGLIIALSTGAIGGLALLMIGLGLSSAIGIWEIVDLIQIATGSLGPVNGDYVHRPNRRYHRR
jgi:TM2 domain-containing membrane protein YozV